MHEWVKERVRGRDRQGETERETKKGRQGESERTQDVYESIISYTNDLCVIFNVFYKIMYLSGGLIINVILHLRLAWLLHRLIRQEFFAQRNWKFGA